MVVFAIQKVKPSYCYTSTQHRLIHPTLQVTVKKILTVTAATKRRVGVSEVWVHPFIFSNFHEKHLVNKLFSIILFSLCLSIILTWQKYLPGTTYIFNHIDLLSPGFVPFTPFFTDDQCSRIDPTSSPTLCTLCLFFCYWLLFFCGLAGNVCITEAISGHPGLTPEQQKHGICYLFYLFGWLFKAHLLFKLIWFWFEGETSFLLQKPHL